MIEFKYTNFKEKLGLIQKEKGIKKPISFLIGFVAEQSRLELLHKIQCFQCLPFLNLHRVTPRVTPFLMFKLYKSNYIKKI
jgi:hypothetical protein